MGGSDFPSNIIEVSVEEHSELHLSLYLTHGKMEDWLAYRGLAGIIEKEDMTFHLMSIAGQKGSAVVWSEDNKEEQTKKIREAKQRQENRAITSNSMIELFKDPSERQKRAIKLKAFYETPEGKESKRQAHIKRSETMRKRRENKPPKLTRSEAQKARRQREREQRG